VPWRPRRRARSPLTPYSAATPTRGRPTSPSPAPAANSPFGSTTAANRAPSTSSSWHPKHRHERRW